MRALLTLGVGFLLARLFMKAQPAESVAAAPSGPLLGGPSVTEPSGRELTPEEATELADAYAGWPAGTPILYTDQTGVLRETTAGKMAEDYRAVAIMDDVAFLPVNPRESNPANGTDSTFRF